MRKELFLPVAMASGSLLGERVGSFPWGQKEKEADLVREISVPQQESFKEHPFQPWRPTMRGVSQVTMVS